MVNFRCQELLKRVFLKDQFWGLFPFHAILFLWKFECLDANYHFYVDDTVIHFVYHASIIQGAFDLILTTLQKWFRGAKLRFNSNKTEYMFISRKNSSNSHIELPADANYSNNVTLLGFNLHLEFHKRNKIVLCVGYVMISCENLIPSEIQSTESRWSSECGYWLSRD